MMETKNEFYEIHNWYTGWLTEDNEPFIVEGTFAEVEHVYNGLGMVSLPIKSTDLSTNTNLN